MAFLKVILAPLPQQQGPTLQHNGDPAFLCTSRAPRLTSSGSKTIWIYCAVLFKYFIIPLAAAARWLDLFSQFILASKSFFKEKLTLLLMSGIHNCSTSESQTSSTWYISESFSLKTNRCWSETWWLQVRSLMWHDSSKRPRVHMKMWKSESLKEKPRSLWLFKLSEHSSTSWNFLNKAWIKAAQRKSRISLSHTHSHTHENTWKLHKEQMSIWKCKVLLENQHSAVMDFLPPCVGHKEAISESHRWMCVQKWKWSYPVMADKWFFPQRKRAATGCTLSPSGMKVRSDNKAFRSRQDKANTPWPVLMLSKAIQSVC